MNFTTQPVSPQPAKHVSAVFVDGKEVGRIEETISNHPQNRFHAIFELSTGRYLDISLVQGFGHTAEEAVADAFAGSRQRGKSYLADLAALEARVIGKEVAA